MLDAFNNGMIDSMYDITPQEASLIHKAGSIVKTADLPRVFSIFFNQNQAPVLANKEVRQALSMVVDKQVIINSVLSGYGTIVNDPIPSSLLPLASTTGTKSVASTSLEAARKVLTDAGWAPNSAGVMERKTKKSTQTLAFSISTADSPDLVQSAKLVQSMWQQLGAQVDVKVFETGELNQSVIRPRHYDSLLFGEIIGPDLDLYAFWHSSQRNDPGLNIAEYVNLKVDKILENARTISDPAASALQYQSFENEIRNDIPAIFLYAPKFIYIVPSKVKGIDFRSVTIPADRFADIYKWYIDTDTVWKIFVANKINN